MKKFFFTFGNNSNLAHCYMIIEAKDRDAARELMFLAYGRRWAFEYDEKSFEGQPERYGLGEVPVGTELIIR